MTSLTPTLAIIPGIGPLNGGEIIILAILGILIFGKRLPEVGRSIGRGIVEFKKGLSGVVDDDEPQVRTPPQIENRQSPTVDTTRPDTPASAAPPATPASEGPRSA